jgi:hypothetical protein
VTKQGVLDQRGVPVPYFPDFTDNFNVSTFYIKTPTILVGVNTNNRHWVHGRSWKWTLDLSIVSIIKRDP